MSVRSRAIQTLAIAAFFGLCFHLFSFSNSPWFASTPLHSSRWQQQQCSESVDLPPQSPTDRLESLREMVAKTKGYYVRDWSLGLGWNNVRYIIEASLYHATLFNRTLVLPSFVYARACEHNITVCASYAFMVNRGDAIGWNDWRELPLEQQMGWRIPIEIMMDLPFLRKTYNVLTVSDYLQLHNISTLETSSGMWDRFGYHKTTPSPSLAVIPNNLFDPPTIVRVDVFPDTGKERPPILRTAVLSRLEAALQDKSYLDWEVAKEALGVATDEEAESSLVNFDWMVLHTYQGYVGMDFLKSPVVPIRSVAPMSRVRGLLDEWGDVNEEVLLLEGEVHLNRKPASLRFTSAAARDDFTTLVLHHIKYLDILQVVATRVVQRLSARVGGRMWVAAQMRRGDFTNMGWAMEGSFPSHLARIQQRLATGRDILRSLVNETLVTFDVPGVVPNPAFRTHDPPLDDDPFYIATDERDPEDIALLKSHGAILIGDLVTIEDRQEVGWSLLFTDVLSLLEQLVLAECHYFYGHAMSSVAGGVVNMRAAKGFDPRTYLID